MSLLEISDLYGGYGSVVILNGVDLRVEKGEIVVMVGPNGAGKSTVMKAVFGLINVQKGRVVFDGEDITRLPTQRIVRRGICYVPQTENVFPSLTVHENLELGAFVRDDDFSEQLDRVYELFPALKERRRHAAGTLSGGQQQMVAIGRALMLEPKLLLLDEPTAGLSPIIIRQILQNVRDINALGISILLVEQNAKQALAFADRGYVLSMGANRYQDTGPNLLANRDVAEMFLGG